MDLFDILACPTCKVAVERRADELHCPACRRAYPIANNVPVMLPDASIPETQYQHDLDVRQNYDPWLHRVVLQSLPASAIVLDMGAGNMALNLPNVIRMDVTLTPYVDVVGDTHALPFLPGSLYFIFSLAVIEHLRQPFLAAEEMFNALRSGGYVYGECNFVFAYHGYPHHYFNATQQGLEQAFAQFTKLRSGVAPYQMPSFAVRSLLYSYARDLGLDGEPDVRELQELIAHILDLPLSTYDSRLSETAALYTAAGTFFFGVKAPQASSEVIPQVVQAAWHSSPELQAHYPNILNIGTSQNVLRWAQTSGRRQHPEIERYFAELTPFGKRPDLAVEQEQCLPEDVAEPIFTHIPDPERERHLGERQRALQQRMNEQQRVLEQRIDALEEMIARKDQHIVQLERLIDQIASGRICVLSSLSNSCAVIGGAVSNTNKEHRHMDLEQARASLAPVWGRSWTLHVERGEGAYLFADDGRRFLDFTCGIGVTNTGHCHPAVVAAAQAQVAKLIHGQANILYHDPMLRLVEALQQVLPPTLDTFFFANSGAEAVEASVKLARQATRRTNIVVFAGSFHGRTVGAMSLTTSKTAYRAGYQPLMPGVFVAPFPYSFHYGWSEAETVQFCLRELEHLLHTQTAPEETAAFLIEPVLGEGGYVPAPAAFMQGLRAIANRHGILLVADEVQTGFGRTGSFWAMEQLGVEADVVVMAKGLASGFPLSGIAARRELMQKWPPNSHGGTYGGNAVACAAAEATIRVLGDENLIANSAARGQQLMAGLRELQSRYTGIGEVRGLGCMVAIECVNAAGKPDGALAKTLTQACFDAGLLLLTCGAYGQVVRWIPPLIVTSEQIDEALALFGHALAQIGERVPPMYDVTQDSLYIIRAHDSTTSTDQR